jgi:hypothetical protein
MASKIAFMTVSEYQTGEIDGLFSHVEDFEVLTRRAGICARRVRHHLRDDEIPGEQIAALSNAIVATTR